MKKKILIICLVMICLCLSLTTIEKRELIAQPLGSQTIIVKGSGEVFGAPDMAILLMGVETLDLDIKVAEQKNANIVKGLVELLLSNNIESKDIQTTAFNVYKKQDYRGAEFLGYQVSHYFSVVVHSLENISSLISLLTEKGANVFRGVSFSIKNKSELEMQALELALAKAKEKASILGEGQFVVHKILEEGVYNNFPMRGESVSYASENHIQAGECVVRAQLTVEFKKV